MRNRASRRSFLKASAGAAAALAAGGAVRSAGRAKKPNLLFLWTDEQQAGTMAAYGNRKIHAPNLNRLAGESVVFERAYVTQPVCTPSRSTVMTGHWPHANGCTANNIPLRPDTACLPELLNDPDYRSAYMGKWHLGDEIFRQHGFDEWVSIEDNYGKYYGPRRDRSKRSDYHHFLIEKGCKPDKGGVFSRGFAAKRPIGQCKPKFLEMKACEFLRRNRGRPFVLHVNFLEPHMPFYGPLDDEHDPSEIELPGNFTDPLEDNEPLRYRMRRAECRARYGKTAKKIRDLIRKYWGLVTQVDRSVGAILKTLADLGLADDTIVVYTSDHGDMMGSHGLVAKAVMYEESSRVPWLMRIPQLGRTSRLVTQPVSHIDLVPTLLALMQKRRDKSLPGQSLLPLINGGKVEQDHVFIEWHPGQGTPSLKYARGLAGEDKAKRACRESTRAVVSPDGWKLCLSDLDKCQLFNLKEDPLEITNLFDSGRHGNVIRRLTGKIHAWQKSVGDKVTV